MREKRNLGTTSPIHRRNVVCTARRGVTQSLHSSPLPVSIADGQLPSDSPAQQQTAEPPPALMVPQILHETLADDECRALVINSSHEMAKEITLQLTLTMPGCSITYAPSLEIARWILKRRRITLVVSSPVLPDGGIATLRPVLEALTDPPDLIVVGRLSDKSARAMSCSTYRFSSVQRVGSMNQRAPTPSHTASASAGRSRRELERTVQKLGADIRNDLNNPLQEIVAMVFIARSDAEASANSERALSAIDLAAKNMAKIVWNLEEKIRNVVGGS